MKKITLILLVAMVPFLTMAQKGKVEYMMIKGIEISTSKSPSADVREMALGNISSENVKFMVAFDYGDHDQKNSEVKEMQAKRFRTMISAVNTAAANGWELVNSDVVLEDKMKTYYCFMRRGKKK